MSKPRERNSFEAFKELVKRACDKLYPGIGRYDRLVYARVVKTFQSSGRVSVGSKLWSVDLEILGPDMQPDPRRGVIADVAIDPIEVSTDGRALFPAIFVGTVVRLGWMYGSRALPFVHSVTAEGLRLPDASSGQLSTILDDAFRVLARIRDTPSGPAVMRENDMIELERILSSLPGVDL